MESLLRKVTKWKDDYSKVVTLIFLLIASCFTVYFLYTVITPKKLRVTFFDVGQGDAIFIETPSGKDVLIDGGASNHVLEHLSKHQGYFDRTIDVMVATHGDADHVTGLIPTLEEYEVGIIVTSPIQGESGIFDTLEKRIEEEGAKVYIAKRGDVITLGDGVEIEILYPRKNISSRIDTNDASVVTLLRYGTHSFLLTGDLSTSYESALITPSLPDKVTVYKAGHHGSNTSSGELLLSRIKPEYSVISAGKDNKYGHPHPEALSRLEKHSQEVLSTIEKGSTTFVSNGELLQVITSK